MTPQKAYQKPGSVPRKPEAAAKAPKKAQGILQEALQVRFGLTASEASVHAALLAMGQLNPYEVSIYSGLPLEEAEPALEALAAKKLVKVMPGIVRRYLAFAPYRGLATLVDEFKKQTATALNEFQARQKQLKKDIPGQFDSASRQLSKGLASNYHSQSKTLRAAATTLRTSLMDLAHGQRKSLTALSDSSATDFSSQTTTLKKNLSQTIDDGIKQLQDAYGATLKEPLKLITLHRQTSQQWLDSSRERLLGHLEAAKTQLQDRLDNASAALQEIMKTTLDTTKANAAAEVEATHRRLGEAAATLNTRIQAFGKKQRQSIDAWQKQQAQMTKQAVQALGQNQRESLNQAARMLTQIRSDADKTLDRESQRVTQDFERSTAEIVSIIDDWSEGATQIGDNLFLNLRTTVSERIQALLKLQKEIEDTVAQWPPTALTFAQLTTLKESLTKLTQAAAKDFAKQVKALEKRIGTELREASLSQLGEEETLLQALADSLVAQQPTLAKNVEATVSKVAKSIDTQSTALLKTADASAKGLQDKLRQQVKLAQDLRQKGKQTIDEEAAAVAGVLGAVNGKLHQFAETRVPAASQSVRDISASCNVKIDQHGKVFGKYLATLEATVARYSSETNQSLQQKLERLQGLVTQYAEEVKTTATRLRGEQAAEIQRSQGAYRGDCDKQWTKRDKQITQALRGLLEQMQKSQRDLIPPLQQAIQDAVLQHAQTALTDYRATLTNEQATIHDQAATALQATLKAQMERDLPTILTKHAVGGMQTLQDAIEQSATAVENLAHQTDSETAQLIEGSLNDLGRTIQEYASANISNLAALNTAINKALDQEFNTLAAVVSSFQDRAKESLTRTTQALGQEDQTLADSIGADLSEIREGCLAPLSEVRTLLQTLGQELASEVDALAHNTEAMASDADAAMKSNLSAFQTAGEALVQDILKETQQLVGQNQEMSQKGQSLIKQQAATVADTVRTASEELRQFAGNRLPQAKGTIRQVSDAYLATIREYQTTFEKQLSGVESEVAAKCDGYVSAVQKELAQLEKAAVTMTQQVTQAGQALDTTLREQIEKSLTTYLTTIDEQGTQLHEEVSNAFQATLDSFSKIQGNLLSVLSQDLQNGKTAVEEAIARAGSTLEEAIRGVSTQSESFGETLRTALATAIDESTAPTGEAFAASHATIDAALAGVGETVGQTLTSFQSQVNANLTASSQSLNQETDELGNAVTADVAGALTALAEASTQTKDKFDQTGREGIRRAGELIRLARDAVLASVEEHNRATAAGVAQFAVSADKAISAQAQQTVKQVFANLKSAQAAMKTEGQALARTTSSLLKQTSAAALGLVETFAQNTEPALTRIEAEAANLQDTLTKLWDSITELEASPVERTWRIVTRQGVQNHLDDMIRRTRTTITLVYPSLKDVPLKQLEAIPPNCRLHLFTSLDRASHQETLGNLLTRQNTRIWHAPKTEFYAGSRDGEEVLIAPIYGEPEEVVAVASDHSSYVALFNKSLGPQWISSAKEIVQRKPVQP